MGDVVEIRLLAAVQKIDGTDAFQQAGKSPVTNSAFLPRLEALAQKGLVTIDRSECPVMINGPHLTIAPEGFFVSLTPAGIDALAKWTGSHG
jgi:hypothetical protein